MTQKDNSTRDYDIHGWLRLRLSRPPRGLAQLVAHQLDPVRPTTPSGVPDVSLLPSSRSRKEGSFYLGDAGDGTQCGFGGSDFWVIERMAAVSIPFESIGRSCEVLYEFGLGFRRVLASYVRPILHLSLLPKSAVAVHSAAVALDGKAILLAGWAESGKSEAMLGLLQRGASFISDKWTILAKDGTACSFPTPITFRGWVLTYMPALSKKLTSSERWRLAFAELASRPAQWLAPPRGLLGSIVQPALGVVARASVPPSRLFGNPPFPSRAVPVSKVFLMMTTSSPQITVRRASELDIVRRLVNCHEYERRALLNLYVRARYAFPDLCNPLIEDARQMETDILIQALGSREAYVVEAHFPEDPLKLSEAIIAYC